jgi:hypothetical protein
MGKILVQFTYSDSDVKVYDGTVKDLAAAGMGNIPERLYHVSAKIENGWYVTDVWESEEAFNKFGETVMPLIVKNGGTPVEPVILPVYKIIIPE